MPETEYVVNCDVVIESKGNPDRECGVKAVWMVTAVDSIDNRVTTANKVFCEDHATAAVELMMEELLEDRRPRYNSIMARRM